MDSAQRRGDEVEVTTFSEVLQAAGLCSEELLDDVIDLHDFARDSAVKEHFRLESQPRRHDPDGTVEAVAPYTRIWLDRASMRHGAREDLVWAGIAYAMTQGITSSLLLGIVRGVAGKDAALSEDEAELVVVIVSLTGGTPYARPVTEDDVRRAYAEATIAVEPLLDSLKDKGVIVVRHAGTIELQR